MAIDDKDFIGLETLGLTQPQQLAATRLFREVLQIHEKCYGVDEGMGLLASLAESLCIALYTGISGGYVTIQMSSKLADAIARAIIEGHLKRGSMGS